MLDMLEHFQDILVCCWQLQQPLWQLLPRWLLHCDETFSKEKEEGEFSILP